MKLNVGIVGYGNLGRAVEKKIRAGHDFNLVAIFSKRDLPGVINYDDVENYKGKIDLLFLCGGSQNELEKQGLRLIKNFNIIDSYDNHARLKTYITKLDRLSKQNGKVALCSFGWDPGLFSFMRALFDGLGFKPYTFWGKGLSQGHTQAIKNIPGVKDAIQFTVPSIKDIEKIKNGEKVKEGKNLHHRECYVVAAKEDRDQVKKRIISMPDYFEGYKTTVHFVGQNKLDSLKTFAHKGQVISASNTINFSLNLKSNPDFTAGVITSFARAAANLIKNEKHGAYTIFDLPISSILKRDKFEYL